MLAEVGAALSETTSPTGGVLVELVETGSPFGVTNLFETVSSPVRARHTARQGHYLMPASDA